MRWISSDQIWKVFFELPAEDYVHLADFHQFGIPPAEQVAIGRSRTSTVNLKIERFTYLLQTLTLTTCFFVSSITPFLLSWPKALFLAFLDPLSRQQKTAAQPLWSEQPFTLLGFLRFLNYSWSATGSSFTAAPFPDLFGWMAGKTPVNLIGWQGRMHRAYGEPAMLLRILFRGRD